MSTGRDRAPRGGRERSQRQLRVGELVRHALVDVLARGDLRDPDLAGASITVTEVRASPDLRNATVFIMPLGGARMAETVDALNRAVPFLRRTIGKTLTMKYLPALGFVADTAFDQSQRIDDLLRSPSVSRDLGGTRPDDADDRDADNWDANDRDAGADDGT
jgi:ribosome-binding factor A